MIKRQNIFELLGANGQAYHSAILTTYAFDPIFFSTFYLPQLNRCGVLNIIVLVDSTQYDLMMYEVDRYAACMEDLSNVTIIRKEASGHGVFHPKVSFFFGEKQGLILAGSGNLTYGGIVQNEEVWSAFYVEGENTKHKSLCSAAWHYLSSLLPHDLNLVQLQKKWISDNTPWLEKNISVSTIVDSIPPDGEVQFIANVAENNLFSQIESILSGCHVNSVQILSPFYDKNGEALSSILERFHPQSIQCVLNEQCGTLPINFNTANHPEVRFYKWGDVTNREDKTVPNLHAKIFQFNTDHGTYLILGSANATSSVLFGKNDEACVLLHNESEIDYFEQLGLSFPKDGVRITDVHPQIYRRPEGDVPATHYQLRIIQAEREGKNLSIYFSKTDIDVKLKMIRHGANDPCYYDSHIIDKHVSIVVNCVIDSIVIVDAERNEVSNRCLVIKEEKVIRSNPNRKHRELESLLTVSAHWDKDLSSILKHIESTEEQPQEKRKGQSKSNHKGPAEDKVLTADKFDNVIVTSKANILNQPNMMIADFLRKAILAGSGYKENRDDTTLANLNDDGSLKDGQQIEGQEESNAGDGSKVIDEKQDRNKTIENTLRLIDRRVYEPHFDLFNKDSQDVKKRAHHEIELVMKGGQKDSDVKGNTKGDLSLNDVSISLINSTLAFQYCIDDQPANPKIQDLFFKNLGQFLLYSRKRKNAGSDYCGKRMVELLMYNYVIALCVLSHFSWRGTSGYRSLSLFVLNIIDAVAKAEEEGLTTDQLLSTYLNYLEIARSKFTVLQESVDAIVGLFSKYKSMDLTVPPADDRYGYDSVVVYRNAIGFHEVPNFRNRFDGEYTNMLRYKLFHPGLSGREFWPPVVPIIRFRRINL